MGLYT